MTEAKCPKWSIPIFPHGGPGVTPRASGLYVRGAGTPVVRRNRNDRLGTKREFAFFGLMSASASIPPFGGLLCRFSARGHRSEIMLGVLIVVFGPDYIAGLSLGLG